ncbi:hypothetical protein M2X72_21300, partial [Klebsiella pneumoniae]|nr:hypothetical protein [Klebsiella pneumoniae]
LNRLIRCVCGKKIGPDPRNFNQRVSLGRNDLLIRTFPKSDKTPSEALEELYDYSFIGFYKAGGSGYGGSEYVFKYRDSRASFSHASTRFRIHPGLIEVLGLKKV